MPVLGSMAAFDSVAGGGSACLNAFKDKGPDDCPPSHKSPAIRP